jgi:nitrite reductase/ring-hydroxylating ferredoxin subunit
MKKIQVQGKEILVANVDGRLYAIDDICTHEKCSLSDGMLQNDVVVCSCHYAQFDVKTGKNVEKPFTGEDVEDEQTYKIEVEGNDVFILI